MKKAKIILGVIALLAVAGGAFAVKARFDEADRLFILAGGSKVTTTQVGTVVYSTTIPNCTTTNRFIRESGGTPVAGFSVTTTNANTVTTFTATTAVGGPTLSTILTYPYCTAIVTATTAAQG